MRYLFSWFILKLTRSAELDEALEDGRMHLPIDLDEANKLPYLQAVIKETLR